LITWNFFSEFLSRCVTIFIDNADIIKKVSLPKICLPVIALFSSSLHFGIVFSLFCVFLILSGTFPGLVILAVIPVFAIQIAFTVGLGILLATVNVFYRDIQQTLGLIMQFWFWLTPIVYLPSGLPAPVETILQLNPMWPIIRGYQTIFLNQLSPDWWGLLYPAFLAILLLSLGLAAFRQLQGEIVDEL
jgi:lipopolysaccharide transport system permease protein